MNALVFDNVLKDKPEATYSFIVMDDSLQEQNGSLTIDLNCDSVTCRRIRHTRSWCIEKHLSHHYEFVLFDCTEQPSEIFYRHFYFEYHQGEVMLQVSELLPYSDAIMNGKFETKMFDSVSDAIVLTLADPFDAPGPKIVYCNKTFCDMTGYTYSELLGRSPRLLQGPESSQEAKRNIRVALEKWQNIKQHMVNYRKDGSTFDVELNISPVADDTGWFSHWISVQRDMFGHKGILEQLKMSNLFLRSSKTACWYLVFSKDNLFWDEQMYQLHDVDPNTNKASLPVWLDKVYKADQEEFSALLSKAVSGESELDFEYRILDRSGSIRWLRVRAELMQEEGQLPHTLSGLCFDVTLEKESEIEIERHRRSAEENAKLASLGELAAGVGHEINNPLSVITTSIDLLELYLEQADSLNENTKEVLDRMNAAGDRIARIVNGLRNVSSLSKETNDLGTLNLVKDAEHTVEMLTDLYGKEGVELNFYKPEDIDNCTIKAEHAGLQQILVNLISNARDAVKTTARKQINVRVLTRPNTCALIVDDTGSGIAEAIQNRIFEPFSSLKTVGEGTGLGLSITKNIVESFGGTISYKTQMGAGTTFVCEFNRVDTSDESSQQKAQLSPVRFLLVEDDAPVADCILALVKTLGCDCVRAENGAEALEILSSSEFDVILTDLKMPVLNGWEFLEELRDRNMATNSLKFIMSGEVITHHENQFRKLKSYSDGILQKPVKRIDLANILEQYRASVKMH